MNRLMIFGVTAICLSMLFVGCEYLENGGYKGVKVGKEIPEPEVAGTAETVETEEKAEETEKPSQEKPEEAVKEETPPTTAADQEWIIPRDKTLPARFFADIADVCTRYGKKELANTLFSEAIARENDDEAKSGFYAKIAEMHKRNREFDKAVEGYEKAAQLTKNEQTKKKHYQELARLCGQLQLYDKGIEAYNYLYDHEEEEQKKTAAKREMYKMYNKSGKLNEIMKPLQDKLAEEPDSIETREELVFIYSQILREPQKAIPHLTRLAEIVEVPDNRKYLNHLVAVYRQLKMHKEHAATMLRIMDQIPEKQREGYMHAIAKIYTDSGAPAKAIEMAEKALEMNPEDPNTLLRVADIHKRNRSDQKAEEYFQKAIELAATDMQKQVILFQYGMANIAVKEYAAAEKLFEDQEKIIADPMLKAQLYQAVSQEFGRAEQTALAEKWIRKMISLDPKNPRSYQSVASYFRRQEKIEEARKILAEGIEAMEKPEDAVPLLMGYFNYSKLLNDTEGAKETLKKIRERSTEERILKWVEMQEKELK